MTTRRVWDPFRELNALHQEFDRVLHHLHTGRRPFARFAFLPGESARAYPLMNIRTNDDNVYVEALAPGLDPESIIVEIVKDQLTLSGEKPGLKDAKPESTHRSERAAGRFIRTVTLPFEVDSYRAQAEYDKGVLSITLPKAEDVKPKRINVSLN